jgi:glycosyltransferase involved in cell wall biosynthesis
MKINFITNIPLSEISGGFSGMNFVAHEALRAIADINYVGPINPPVHIGEHAASKASRSVGMRGNFFFFSDRRLRKIADEVSSRTNPTADLDFYHGFTPWSLCRTSRPYMAWNDCCFSEYLRIYHNADHFRSKDVARICQGEVEWMNKAKRVILSSEWARNQLEIVHGVPSCQTTSVGIFGAMEVPAGDTWSGGKNFYFISTDYVRKNGAICRRAMDTVWQSHPDARLHIIGAKPPESDLVPDRVIYEGFFSKSKPDELQRFRAHLANAYALLHPTDADTTAMILIEAAFFGCPSISVNDFAIPEVLGSSSTNLLLERPVDSNALATAMCRLLEDKQLYLERRQSARIRALAEHQISDFQQRMRDAVTSGIGSGSTIGSTSK